VVYLVPSLDVSVARSCASQKLVLQECTVRYPRRDWHDIEKLYVFGEVLGFRDDGTVVRHYPSIRELCRRLSITRSVLANRSKRDGWAASRARFQTAERERTWKRLAEQALADGDPP